MKVSMRTCITVIKCTFPKKAFLYYFHICTNYKISTSLILIQNSRLSFFKFYLKLVKPWKAQQLLI